MDWVPPFLVALAGAAAGEMAAGLLLYSSGGFLRALTVVLVAETAALGLGFLVSSSVDAANVAALRRRWLFAVFAFAAAAVFAGVWSLSNGAVGADLDPRLGRGLGLGFLAALPLFSTGSVLGALTAAPARRASDLGGDAGASARRGGVGAPSFFGAAAGLLFTGLYGVPILQPASLYLFCVVAVSGGALLHGWMTDRAIRIVPVEESETDDHFPEGRRIRRERRVRTTPPAEIRVLYLDGRVADAGAVESPGAGDGGAGSDRGPGSRERGEVRGRGLRACLPWQRHVLDVVRDEGGPERGGLRVLMIGVGTGALLSDLASARDGDVVALEWAAPWEGSRGRPVGGSRETGEDGNEVLPAATVVDDWESVSTSAPPGGFDVLVVHLRLLPRKGPFGHIDLEFLDEVLSFRSSGGIALLGGIDLDDETATGRSLEWLSSRFGAPASLFRPRAGTWAWEEEPWDDLVGSLGDLGGGLVTCRSEEASAGESAVDGGPGEEATS